MSTFAGLPISGDVNKSSPQRTEQRPIEELEPVLRDVLAHDDVIAVKWQQYTPYFNDGDECVFGINCDENFVKIAGLPDDAGDYEDGFVSPTDVAVKGGEETRYQRTGERETDRWGYTRDKYEYVKTGVTYTGTQAAHDLERLQQMIGSGAFNDALYELFGDHCNVIVYKDRIEVEEYSHD